MHLWPEKTGPPMSAAHFGFGVGGIIAPQVAKSFLSPDASVKPEESATILAPNVTNIVDDGQIEIPYAIVASLAFIFSIFLLAFYLKGPPEGFPENKGVKLTAKALAKMLSPSSCTDGDTFFGFVLFVLLFLYFIQASGGECVMGE